MKRFVIGDIHGAHKALIQCLKRSKFDKDVDQLIVLGDVVDGWPQVKESIEELLSIKNLIYIKGNHDVWFQEWFITKIKNPIWTKQGGDATLKSYNETRVPLSHIDLISSAKYYYIDHNNNVFVHGGFDWNNSIEDEKYYNLVWDRDLFYYAARNINIKISKYNEIFIGHTQLQQNMPLNYSNLWNLDTAAGWTGCLTMLNIDTKEIFQSDSVMELYYETEEYYVRMKYEEENKKRILMKLIQQTKNIGDNYENFNYKGFTTTKKNSK